MWFVLIENRIPFYPQLIIFYFSAFVWLCWCSTFISELLKLTKWPLGSEKFLSTFCQDCWISRDLTLIKINTGRHRVVNGILGFLLSLLNKKKTMIKSFEIMHRALREMIILIFPYIEVFLNTPKLKVWIFQLFNLSFLHVLWHKFRDKPV